MQRCLPDRSARPRACRRGDRDAQHRRDDRRASFALAGGVDRFAFVDSQIGIHRSSLLAGGGSLEDGQQLLANYLRYFSSMGIDPELVAIAGNVSSERIRWLTQAESLRLDLVTGFIER